MRKPPGTTLLPSAVGAFIRNYLSIGPMGVRIFPIKNVNILLGQNNSGKSTILEALFYIVFGSFNDSDLNFFYRKKGYPELYREYEYDEPIILDEGSMFSAPYQVRMRIPSEQESKGITKTKLPLVVYTNKTDTYSPPATVALEQISHPLYGKMPVRIIQKLKHQEEIKPTSKLIFGTDGKGTVALIKYFLIGDGANHEIITEFIAILNIILALPEPIVEINIRAITTAAEIITFKFKNEEDFFDIFRNGDGINCVVQIAAVMFLLPKYERKQISEFIYLIEELENHLHPKLLRNLYYFIADKMISDNGCCFITSHSNVLIDLAARGDRSQIFHIYKQNAETSINPLDISHSARQLLEDIGARPSDLLLSNCVIWVEGPSDRFYIKFFIDLVSEGKFKEGRHFTFAFYGGSIRSHLTAIDGDGTSEDLLNIMKINHRVIYVYDSDKRAADTPLNANKLRVHDEVLRNNGLPLCTAGRTIENYLSSHVLTTSLDAKSSIMISEFSDVVSDIRSLPKLKSIEKVALASRFISHCRNEKLALTEIDGGLGLSKFLEDICGFIERSSADQR